MKTYIQEAIRTKSGLKVLIAEHNEDLLHATLGIVTESGELTDQLKKHLFYNKPLDKQNIKEELGDLLWYMALLCNWLDISFDELMSMNIEKLKIRYPDLKWTQEHALNRDIKKEMEAIK